MEFKEEGSDDDYDGASKKPISGKKKQKNLQKYVQKAKKPNPNGRVVGRKLVMWHRKSSKLSFPLKKNSMFGTRKVQFCHCPFSCNHLTTTNSCSAPG